MCPIYNTCEQLCALDIIGGSGSDDVTLKEVCSCMNGFVLEDNMKNCTGKWMCVCVCVIWYFIAFLCMCANDNVNTVSLHFICFRHGWVCKQCH